MWKLFSKWLQVLILHELAFFLSEANAASPLLDIINPQQKDLSFGHHFHN